MDVLLANPRGFCAGVVRAVDIVDMVLETHGAPVYVFHEIVHNRRVVEGLHAKGAVFVDDLDGIPPGAVTVFSAHGVSDAIREQAKERRLRVIDATCPLVTKVHLEAARYSRQGYGVVIIGHPEHEEVQGTRDSVPGPVYVVSTPAEVASLDVEDPARVAYVTQTTLSLDDTRDVIEALRGRFPGIRGPELENICYATQNRQNAVKDLAARVDVVIVVGARNSSNSNRLREVAAELSGAAYLVADARELEPEWVAAAARVGVTAGASAPEILVREVVDRLRQLGAARVEERLGNRETVRFKLPEGLEKGAAGALGK